MDKTVYTLCVITSAVCAFLLFRGYLKTKMKLLLWSTICFICLTLTNFLVFIDLVVYADTDIVVYSGIELLTLRNLITFFGLSVLIYGMVEETV